MINISEATKRAWLTPALFNRSLSIYLENGDVIRNAELVEGSFQLDENLCQKKEFKYGSAEQNRVQFKTSKNLIKRTGIGMSVRVTSPEGVNILLGTFKLTSCKRDAQGLFQCEGYSVESLYTLPKWVEMALNAPRTTANLAPFKMGYIIPAIMANGKIEGTFEYDAVTATSYSTGFTINLYGGKLAITFDGHYRIEASDFSDCVYIDEPQLPIDLVDDIYRACALVNGADPQEVHRLIKSIYIVGMNQKRAVECGHIVTSMWQNSYINPVPIFIPKAVRINIYYVPMSEPWVAETYQLRRDGTVYDVIDMSGYSTLWELPCKSEKTKAYGLNLFKYERPDWADNFKAYVDDFYELQAVMLTYGRDGVARTVRPRAYLDVSVCGTFFCGEKTVNGAPEGAVQLVSSNIIHKGTQYQLTDVEQYGSVAYDVAHTEDGKVLKITKGYTFRDGATYYIKDNHFLVDVDNETMADSYIEEVFSDALYVIGFAQVKATTEMMPWLECGDTLILNINGVEVPTIVLKRTIKGINGATDTFDTSSAVVDYFDKLPAGEE